MHSEVCCAALLQPNQKQPSSFLYPTTAYLEAALPHDHSTGPSHGSPPQLPFVKRPADSPASPLNWGVSSGQSLGVGTCGGLWRFRSVGLVKHRAQPAPSRIRPPDSLWEPVCPPGLQNSSRGNQSGP